MSWAEGSWGGLAGGRFAEHRWIGAEGPGRILPAGPWTHPGAVLSIGLPGGRACYLWPCRSSFLSLTPTSLVWLTAAAFTVAVNFYVGRGQVLSTFPILVPLWLHSSTPVRQCLGSIPPVAYLVMLLRGAIGWQLLGAGGRQGTHHFRAAPPIPCTLTAPHSCPLHPQSLLIWDIAQVQVTLQAAQVHFALHGEAAC